MSTAGIQPCFGESSCVLTCNGIIFNNGRHWACSWFTVYTLIVDMQQCSKLDYDLHFNCGHAAVLLVISHDVRPMLLMLNC